MSNKPPTDQDVNDYLGVLMDATKQRSSKDEIERCAAIASCITEIYNTLKKHKVTKTDDIVHALVSVMVIPVMMLEPDPRIRAHTIKELAISFTRDILFMMTRDSEIKDTESGRELDRLRNMVSDSGMFKHD